VQQPDRRAERRRREHEEQAASDDLEAPRTGLLADN
jgi:hypothetical protein